MNLKYLGGKWINDILLILIKISPSSLFFIPNGRFMELDIIRSKENITTIFDVGANIGQTALSYIRIFTQAKIYSFEPVNDTYDILLKNLKCHLNIYPNQFALGSEIGVLRIAINVDSQINSLKNQTNELDILTELINIETGENYCTNNNINQIDLLKIDTEGFELDVLKGFSKEFLRDKVKFIYCEINFDKTDHFKTHFSDVENYLSKCSFITTGFYEPSRWGKSKLMLGFCNVLFTNSNLIGIF